MCVIYSVNIITFEMECELDLNILPNLFELKKKRVIFSFEHSSMWMKLFNMIWIRNLYEKNNSALRTEVVTYRRDYET